MNRKEILTLFTQATRPLIAVPVTDNAPAEGMDIAELRLDLFTDRSRERACAEARKYAGIPSIATIRSGAEGGQWSGPEPERLALYHAVLADVAAVDIELSSTSIRQKVIAAAHAADRAVIVSFHDFQETPPWGTLEGVVRQAVEAGADIVKIAAQVHTALDLQNLARVLVTHPDIPMIVIGMGEKGKISRVAFPGLGSVLTFASGGRSTAPGQPSLQEMRALFAACYP